MPANPLMFNIPQERRGSSSDQGGQRKDCNKLRVFVITCRTLCTSYRHIHIIAASSLSRDCD